MDRLGVGKRPFAATLSLQAAVGVGSMLGGAVSLGCWEHGASKRAERGHLSPLFMKQCLLD